VISGTAAAESSPWRFIDSGPLPGATNMAADMAITQVLGREPAPPTLRVYQWSRPTISLGYHQSEKDIDLLRCSQDGIDVVYRPTGGRAILHDNEVTYAVILPPSSSFFALDIFGVYEFISRCLVHALQSLNIDADFERAKKTPDGFSRGELSTLCYASSIQYEIAIQGRKLVGSAQRRIHNSVLQHGSILLGDEHLAVAHYLAGHDDQWRHRVHQYLKKQTVSINQLTRTPVTRQQMIAALRQGFAEELRISFTDGQLSNEEMKQSELLRSKFAILEN